MERWIRRHAKSLINQFNQTLGKQLVLRPYANYYTLDGDSLDSYYHDWRVGNTSVHLKYRDFLPGKMYNCHERQNCLTMKVFVRRHLSKHRKNYLHRTTQLAQVQQIKKLTDAMHRGSMDEVMELLPAGYNTEKTRTNLINYQRSVLWAQPLLEVRFVASINCFGSLSMRRDVQLGSDDSIHAQTLKFTFNENNEIVQFYGYPK